MSVEAGNLLSVDSTKETIDEVLLFGNRLSAVQECVKRARIALTISFFAALVTCAALWNAEFSQDKLSHFSVERILEGVPASEQSNGFPMREEIQKQVMIHWLNGLYISVPFLGVSVGANDFTIYNSAGMLFLTIYHLLSKRRENREVGWFFRDLAGGMYTRGITNQQQRRDLEITAYRAVCAYMVFNVPTHNDRPIDSMSDPRIYRLPDYEEQITGIRGLISPITWAPFVSICFTLMYSAAHFKVPSLQSPLSIGISLVLMVLEALVLTVVGYFTVKTVAFMKATRLLIVEFREREKEGAEETLRERLESFDKT